MIDLERTLRETLAARVSHLTDQRLDTDRPLPAAPSRRRPLRAIVLPAAAAVAVAAIAVSVVAAVDSGGRNHRSAASITPPLVGTDWQLESIRQHGQTTHVPTGIDARIRFDGNGKALGFDGCNLFGLPVTPHGSAITFGAGGSTTDARCHGTRATTEQGFMTVLPTVDRWTITDGKLRLESPDGSALTFHVRRSG
jgi:heat shock protein HslJ